MPIYKGSNEVTGLWLGAKEITRVWKGTDLVYQKGSPPGPAEYTLFDNDWVSGVPWSGNLLPRPPYTTQGTYNFSYVDTLGYMQLTVNCSSSYSPVNHNCHVCTSQLITVPANATKLCFQLRNMPYSGSVYGNWGLLPADAPNSMDTSAGGQLSGITLLTTSDELQTQILTLNSDVKGAQMRAIFNVRRNVKSDYTINVDIYKVWFE